MTLELQREIIFLQVKKVTEEFELRLLFYRLIFTWQFFSGVYPTQVCYVIFMIFKQFFKISCMKGAVYISSSYIPLTRAY